MKLSVRNFGPIHFCEYEINDFNVFIGRQASGKSTIAKLIYFFLNARDEVYNLTLNILQQKESDKVRDVLPRILRQRFVEFFGPGIQNQNMHVEFIYSEKLTISIELEKNDTKFIRVRIGESLIRFIIELVNQNKNRFTKEIGKVKLFRSEKKDSLDFELEKVRDEIEKRIETYFGFSESLLFIPAGRSLLSTLNEQLQFIDAKTIDYTMKVFIQKIASTKSFFSTNIETIIEEKYRDTKNENWKRKITKAYEMMNVLTQGSFYHDREGDKIFINNDHYVKISFASSGQQESIWISLSLFLLILDEVKAIVFIEEPEAHLFPEAQALISSYIVMVHNQLNTKFFITTHSPYILSALNNNIYASNLDKKNIAVSSVMAKMFLLNSSMLNTYMVSNGEIQNIFNNEVGLIDVEKIDDCSKEINKIYGELENLEFENDCNN